MEQNQRQERTVLVIIEPRERTECVCSRVCVVTASEGLTILYDVENEYECSEQPENELLSNARYD